MSVPLFASRIAGLPVRAPDGTPTGRVVDLVVVPGPPDAAPSVTGFVISVPGRRTFLPASRVAAIDVEGLHLATPTVDLRRFAKRPQEVLAMEDLVGRRLAGDRVVNDVAVVAVTHRRRGWEVLGVHVRPRGPFRHRRDGTVRPWKEVAGLFPATEDRYAGLRGLHAADVARRVLAMPVGERATALTSLDDEQLADALAELPETLQAAFVAELGLERGADVLEAMEPDDAADLLEELPADERTELLGAMLPDEAAPIRRVLVYPADSAGGLMHPQPVVLTPSDTVAEALARLREPELPSALATQVFVTDEPVQPPTGVLLGTCGFQQLLREAPSTPLAAIAVPVEPRPITPDTALQEVVTRLASYDLLAVPVCDRDGRLLGVVTVDDALERLLPDTWRSEA